VKRENKRKIVEDLGKIFDANGTYYLVDFKRMRVSQSVELRKALRKISCSYKVVKNRLALRAEWEQLRAATAHASDPMAAWRTIRPWLPLLAPLAGFLAVRTLRRSESALGGLISAVKWIQPLYSLWRRLASRQHREETPKPTTSV